MQDYFKWQGAQQVISGAATTLQYLLIDAANPSVTAGNLIYIGGANWIIAQCTNATGTGGAVNPKLVTTVETSLDGTNWYNILTMADVVSTATVSVMAGSRHMLVATAQPCKLGDFLRFKHVTTADSGGPEVYTINNILMLGN